MRPTVASLVPAATDLIVGMGAAKHLVAISNFDIQRPELAGLPRVGDYANIDWERLATLRPDILIVFMAPDRMPPGLKQKAARYHIRLQNCQIERLDDLFTELGVLGKLLGEQRQADATAARIRTRLDAVRAQVAHQAKVPTLIVREPDLSGVVGQGNFLNDLLELAGGENVIQTTGWPAIDKEQLITTRAKVIIHLMPDASADKVARARQAWSALALPDDLQQHVHILTDWYLLQGGVHVAETAEQFARALHP